MSEQEAQIKPLTFRVEEKGQWAYILWPWTSVEGFLYDALEWGAKYKLRSPAKISRHCWIEFVPSQGAHGEYRTGLYFGSTFWGPHMFRQFNVRSSYYLTQHGLDGLPGQLWGAACEYSPGEPVGQVRIAFRVSTKKGAFEMTFYDWLDYFVSGRNGHISDMGITITKRKGG